MATKELEQAVVDDDTTSPSSVEHWEREFKAADKRQEKFFTRGDRIVERYLDQRLREEKKNSGPEFRLNLFHTHVSMLSAMLYGRIPEVNVARKWQDSNDDEARVAAEIFNRLLNTSVEEPGANFGDVLRACLQDRLLPGHGIARVRYEFESEEVDNPYYDEELGEEAEDNTKTLEDLLDESAPIDYIHWRDFKWGFGRMWADVPWIAFRSFLDKATAKDKFGEELAEKIEYSKQKITQEGSLSDTERSSINEGEIWEVWCKKSGHVYFYSPGCDELLDSLPDPLGLKGFFPAPEPMIANPTTTLYQPTSDWQITQDLYNEIDLIQTRISMITKAVKVVGVYDQTSEAIKRMMTEGFENDLIPVDNWAMFAEKGGVKGSVDWFPVQDVAAVLKELEGVRQNTIQLLYEVTGLSDILRGAAGPDRESAESAGSRTKFASIRIQHLQEEFARFASDLMTLRAQVVGLHWEPETILLKSNANSFLEDQQAIQAGISLIKSQPQTWPWRVEIKAESIAMIDYAQMQRERVEFLTVMGTFVQSMSGLVSVAPEAAPLLLEMMKWGLAAFKGSQQIEGLVDKMVEFAIKELQKPKGEGENPKLAEIKAKADAKQQEMTQKHQMEMQKIATQFQQKMKELSGETDAGVMREQMQAYFNIMEKEAAEYLKQSSAKQKAALDLKVARAKGD